MLVPDLWRSSWTSKKILQISIKLSTWFSAETKKRLLTSSIELAYLSPRCQQSRMTQHNSLTLWPLTRCPSRLFNNSRIGMNRCQCHLQTEKIIKIMQIELEVIMMLYKTIKAATMPHLWINMVICSMIMMSSQGPRIWVKFPKW